MTDRNEQPRAHRRRSWLSLLVLLVVFAVVAWVPTSMAVLSFCGFDGCEHLAPSIDPPVLSLVYWGAASLLYAAPVAIADWAPPRFRLPVAAVLAVAVFWGGLAWIDDAQGSLWSPTAPPPPSWSS